MASSWFERARRNTNLALNSVFATFIAALLTVCLASTALAERSEQLEGDQQREVPALWQINLGEKRGFLFGSIHFGSDALYPLPTEVMAAFRSVKTLAVEVDIEAVDNAELGQFMSRHGVYPVDESLAAEIGPANWQKVVAAAQTLGLESVQLVQQRPWLAALTISIAAIQKSGVATDSGIDLHFLRNGRESHEIVPLETVVDQMGFFATLSQTQQLGFLMETLDELDTAGEFVNEIVAAWRRGDSAALDQQVNGQLRESRVDGVYDALIVKRNRHMAERIQGLMQEGDGVFVVVGAGHLVGDDSVVYMLRQRGLDVWRVSY